MLPWENWGFNYSQISEGGFIINKQCIKAQYFYNLKQQRSANKNGANVPGSTRDYCNLLHWPSSWHYLDLLCHVDESQKGRNGCPRL